MTFKKGHTQSKKLTTDELKLEAFDSYLAHLAKGKSKKSWWFEKDDLTLTWETMETYIKNEPSIFSSIKIKTAQSKGYQIWEQIAEDSASGENLKANTASLQMVMRNKFGWDKEEYANKYTNESLVEKFLRKIDQASEEK